MQMRRLILVCLMVAAVVGLAATVWWHSMTQSVAALESRGKSDLAVASDRLVSNLLRFRLLVTWVASGPQMKPGVASATEIASVLQRANDTSGALDFVLIDRDRRVIASASGQGPFAWLHKPFVNRAFNGALGRDVMNSGTFGRRAYYFAAPVFSKDGSVARVLVAIVDLQAIEAEFGGSKPVVFISDASGQIYFSNRSELVLLQRGKTSVGGANVVSKRFLGHRSVHKFGADIWTLSAGRYLPERAIHISRDLPVIGMRAEALVGLKPAFEEAWLQAAVAGMAGLLFAAAIFFFAMQRRVLAKANEALEGRVRKRTHELSELNASLRAEVAERQEAENALRRAQADLVQAGKLSALGKMSAGISHELNQPLMAIQSFAENAVTFLDRGDSAMTARNLQRIGDLARRMGRIIRNFRAFARQEKETVHKVDLVPAVEAAVDLCAQRLEEQGVTLARSLPDAPVWVQGGEVRLQQVVLNLISNAIDAMECSDERRISLSIDPGTPVVLTVRDTGPGIEAPEKVFEPFYTTKEIGETEGMGLGLSISYGLVQSFGGSIRGANDPRGGAVFTVELQPWSEEMTA